MPTDPITMPLTGAAARRSASWRRRPRERAWAATGRPSKPIGGSSVEGLQ